MAEKDESLSINQDRLIGTKLGDYKITSVLATGGMARIYKGTDTKLQRQVAVKVLEKTRMEEDKTLIKRFEREARAVAALDHDNIITIYQYGEEQGVYFLAMKLIKGKDLAHELTRLRRAGQKMDIRRALYILDQVASALDYAHDAKIVHRDVKPSNILIDKDDKAVLTDFGLVLRKSSETTMGTAFGTPRYIAPEQAVSSNQAQPQSDIYALGTIAYEVLTGETPFNGDTAIEIALSQISEVPRLPRSLNPSIPEAAEKELLKALEKDPEKRQAKASELIDGLKRAYGMTDATNPSLPGKISLADAPITSYKPVAIVNSDDMPTETVAPEHKGGNQKAGLPIPLIAGVVMVVAALVLFVVLSGSAQNGATATESPEAQALTDAAPANALIALFYDEFTFTMYNSGSYDLNVARLKFIRGTDDVADDYNGDRFTADRLPSKDCAIIRLSDRRAQERPECPSQVHFVELLQDPNRFFWRAEPDNYATFEVQLDGDLVARCDSAARGQVKECRFTWPVLPETSS